MSTTKWRSIEKDPPNMGKAVWISNHEKALGYAILWDIESNEVKGKNWTHWSPCEPPADLPPAPKTPFEEWFRVDACAVKDGKQLIPVRHAFEPIDYVRYDSAEIIFNAGYSAGKAAK